MQHLILTRKFVFNFPEALQYNHLLDIWHLNKAHWFTLFGISINNISLKKTNKISKICFDLHRFGRVFKAEINQDKSNKITTVSVAGFKLEFYIETIDKISHWLHVRLFANRKWYKLLLPLLDIIFYLTVIEDKIYYQRFKYRKR